MDWDGKDLAEEEAAPLPTFLGDLGAGGDCDRCMCVLFGEAASPPLLAEDDIAVGPFLLPLSAFGTSFLSTDELLGAAWRGGVAFSFCASASALRCCIC